MQALNSNPNPITSQFISSGTIEESIFSIEDTIKAREAMKSKGVVDESKLQELAVQILDLEVKVKSENKGATNEVKDILDRAESLIRGLDSPSSNQVRAALAIAKSSLLGLETIDYKEEVKTENKQFLSVKKAVTSFPDVKQGLGGHWAYQDIMDLVGRGSIGGYPDGTFGPGRNITFAEFLSIGVRLVEKDIQGGPAGAH